MSWPVRQIVGCLCKFRTFHQRVVLLSEMFKQKTYLERTEKSFTDENAFQ